MPKFKYLFHYPESLLVQVEELLESGKLAGLLQKKYSVGHQIQSNKALYAYTMEIKQRYLRKSDPLSKIEYSDKVSALNALGTHSRVSRVQGAKLKAKKEIRIDGRFRNLPEPFLRMLVVHELAHLKEMDHNKAFYKLCEYMEPDYHQLELDLRIYLTWLEHEKKTP